MNKSANSDKPKLKGQQTILQVALPTPLRRAFDYLPPSEAKHAALIPGVRVRVPFRQREMIGVLLAVSDHTLVPRHKLKPAIAVLDEEPCITPSIFSLLQWAAAYYQHPIGDVVLGALPRLLRQGQPSTQTLIPCWRLTSEGASVGITSIKRAPKQVAAIAILKQHPEGLTQKQLSEQAVMTPVLKRLTEKGWIERCTSTKSLVSELIVTVDQAITLTDEQSQAINAIHQAQPHYHCFLLHGVTGSGKTEVYLKAIESVLQAGRQAMVLVPEIGLTPQTLSRFQQRFSVPIAVFHSGLTDRERLNAWLQAKEGIAKIIIGTRSVVFTPLQAPGILIVDEEHDLSFKQQDNFRYSARDVAVFRARQENIPIVLGSATPSLESLRNAIADRYTCLRLTQRAGLASQPTFQLVDLCTESMTEGLSARLLSAMKQHLADQGQVLLFLNRRGFSPSLLCRSCGWVATCKRCDAKMTLHFEPHHLRCHHCDGAQKVMQQCEACKAFSLHPLGIGTERLEHAIAQHFPQAKTVRIDRDTTGRKGSMQGFLKGITQQDYQILIGTQMLTKGHHFPHVTLVAILNADSGLLSADFRGTERFAQLLIQVAGRAGRAEKPGEVYIQTHNPDHPLLQQLIHEGYDSFSRHLLSEREAASLPPFHACALLRAEATQKSVPLDFLSQVRTLANALTCPGVQILGPIPAPMERRADRYRAQLLLQAHDRSGLQGFLKQLMQRLEKMKTLQNVRWSLDVDPVEML